MRENIKLCTFQKIEYEFNTAARSGKTKCQKRV